MEKDILIQVLIGAGIILSSALSIFLIFYLKSNYPDTQTMKTFSYLGRKQKNNSFIDLFFSNFRKDASKMDDKKKEYNDIITLAYQRLNIKMSVEEHEAKISSMTVNYMILSVVVFVVPTVILGKLNSIFFIAGAVLFLCGILSRTIVDSVLMADIDKLNKGVNLELSKLCFNLAAIGKKRTLADVFREYLPYSTFLKNDIQQYLNDTHRTLDINALIELTDRITLFGPMNNLVEFTQLTFSMYTQNTDPVVSELAFKKLGERICLEETEAYDMTANKKFSLLLALIGMSVASACTIFMVPYLLDAIPALLK